MRDIADWSRPIERALRGWPEENDRVISAAGLADIELGLHLLLEVLPEGRAIDVWPLLGGYPYAEVFNPELDEAGRRRIDNARHYLAGLRRRHLWERELQRYIALEQQYRGFELKDVRDRPMRREPSLAAGRFELYDRVLDTVPVFATRPLPIAGAGEHRFSLADRTHSVRIPQELAAGSVVAQFRLGEAKAGQGKPITVSRSDLRDAAREMDDAERANSLVKPRRWEQSLGDVELAVAGMDGFDFTKEWEFTIDGLFHLVGMVGAGKSTIMHLLTYHCVTKLGLRVTLVLGDVAESLRATDMFNLLADDRVRAAPIVGRSTRERHIHRLHRRKHTAGASSMLDHADRSFDYLSSACPVDALRGVEDAEPLRLHEAPCTQLKPVAAQAEADPFAEEEPQVPKRTAKPKPHGCPVWNRCPRHHAARQLAEVPVWVATMPGLLHSAVPQHQTEARVRYLEAAADRSDLIIIDEADRIQTQLDVRFAPAATLCGKGEDSWIDWLQRHTIDQISSRGRIQLSNHDISTWKRALNTVSSAADRIYSMLNDDAELRQWVSTDYFSAMTLHRELYRDWHPGPPEGGDVESAEADSLFGQVLNDFRDRPIQPRLTIDDDPRRALVKELVDLTNSLVNTELDHDRLRGAIRALTAETPRPVGDTEVERHRFAFTLLVAALDNQLTTLTSMWPRVEAALNLESAGNALTRRPPRDYEPVMAESPMGNVLGYQFTPEEPGPPRHSGALRFFHCSGLGRDLLLRLPKLTADDGLPGPHVMAMSATSWAGTSSRYHLHAPVDAILQPNQDNIDAIRQTAFKREFLLDKEGHPLRLSGQPTPGARTAVLKEMLRQLAVPDRELIGSTSMLQDELEAITDPRRRRILLLTGSYDEARTAADYLNGIEEWAGKVTLLIADDADNDDAWFSLRRGDLASYPSIESKILIAPLLAVERGHNIVLGDGTAAIGSVYFLARPHDRPDDINLAIHAINDWAMRFVHGGEFAALRYSHPDPDTAATEFRRLAVRRWRRYLTRRVAWSALNPEDKDSFTWDQLVVVWQVIGRLVRGGVPARVKFCDAAFAPGAAADKAGADTPKTSVLKRFEYVLRPYFDPDSAVSGANKTIASALLQPFWDALIDIDNRE